MQQQLLTRNIITSKGKINPQLSRWDHYKQDIEWLKTNSPFKTENISEIVYCLWHQLDKRPRCLCQREKKFDKFTTGYNKFCSHECYGKSIIGTSGWRSKASKDKINQSNIKSVQKRRKNGTYTVTENTRKKQSESAKRTLPVKKLTNLLRYGVSNPGVLGGNVSEAATKFIQKFINDRTISPKLCMYGNEELYQMIELPKQDKKKYAKYDLVVFNSIEGRTKKDIKDIKLILEYNGPWHYHLYEILKDPNGMSTPYKNCKITKKDTYIYDLHKRKHFSYVKEYYIFWEKEQILIKK